MYSTVNKTLPFHKASAAKMRVTRETEQDGEVDKKTVEIDDENKNQEALIKAGQSLRMCQLLRADALNLSARDGVLNHLSHRHPLVRLHLQETEEFRCNFCDLIISGQAYACSQQCDYYLHELCSNFPREIRHDLHPGYGHTLLLKPFQSRDPEQQFHCAACSNCDSDYSLFHSYYGCESCSFNLHLECCSIPIILTREVMKYSLHLFLSFPITSEAATPFCSICAKSVPTSGCWVFYNHDHDFLCHFVCAAVKVYGIENHSMAKLQSRLQALSITNRPPNQADQPCEGVMHFSHRHALKEYSKRPVRAVIPLVCSMCNFSFSDGYACVDCGYFIDKNCFSIPSKIQHMSHPKHPLKFTSVSDIEHEKICCPGCQANSGSAISRVYYCAPCKFYISRYCAAAPKTLTLADGISYKLFFTFPFEHEKAEIKCNLCSAEVVKDGLLYYSLVRDEVLHLLCALEKESGKAIGKLDELSIMRLNELRIAD